MSNLKQTRVLPSFEGVATTGQATLRAPIGFSYEQIHINYSGVTLAQMTGIRVVGNGKVIQRWSSGTNLDNFNRYHGRAAAAGILTLDFTRHGLKTREGEELTKLGTGMQSVEGSLELSTLAIEIDITGAAGPVLLNAWAVQSDPSHLGLIRHVREHTYSPSAAGEFQISDIPKGHLFNGLHFLSAIVTELRVERDNYSVFDRTAALNNLVQTDGGFKVPQANIYVLDPTEHGYGSETLQTFGVHDLRFTATVSGAGTLPIIVDSIAPLA